MEVTEKNSGGLFCLHTLPQFASSNWPVITNLKNTVDVRYDRASSVPRRAGSGSKRARPCVMPCQNTPKKWDRASVRVEDDENFSRECESVRKCVSLSLRTVQDRAHFAQRTCRNFLRGDCPTYPLRHNPPHSRVVLSV